MARVLGDDRSLSFVSLARILYTPVTNARRSQPLNNATAFGIVRADFNLHSVADCEAYVMNLKIPSGLANTLCPPSKATRKKSPRTASVTVPRKRAVASFIIRHE